MDLHIKAVNQSEVTISPRQLEIIQGVALGKTTEKIGSQLHLTQGTIKTHLRALYRKINAKNAANAVYILSRHGILK